ncbi:MAG TPA: metal ABC transporter permease [Spirochaetota bacterium]|nr:metal ABC transporter permease [Spirochaetota bacterium]
MMNLWYSLINMLPFEWTEYGFMKSALLAVMIISPAIALTGTMVVGNRMSFFSHVIGHSALTGLAVGLLFSTSDPRPVMILFAVILAVAINIFLSVTKADGDTVMGVFASATTALGIALLSRGGSFSKYTVYLIGDILSITPSEILYLVVILAAVIFFWVFLAGRISLISVESSLLYGKIINPFVVKTAFSILVALIVILSIKWVGILIINSLFILPAAAARIHAKNLRSYFVLSALIGLISGISGLMISYYTESSCGAAVVLVSAGIYAISVLLKHIRRSI